MEDESKIKTVQSNTEQKKKKITVDELWDLLKTYKIKDKDLTEFDFKTNYYIDFSGKQLENIDFSGNTLKNINFYKSTLIDCKFEKAVLDGCNFSFAEIQSTGGENFASFMGSKIHKTYFVEANINACDFKHAEITDTYFKRAILKYIDFFNTRFKGHTIFEDCKIESSSINYVSFETFCITQDNLIKKSASGALVQENDENYKNFLTKWDRPGWNKHNDIKRYESVIEKALKNRYQEAGRIYSQLSALWEEKGHNRDADWAYIQKKRMERKQLWYESKDNKFFNRTKAFLNLLLDWFLGYGVSMYKVIRTYILINILFGLTYWLFLKLFFLRLLY